MYSAVELHSESIVVILLFIIITLIITLIPEYSLGADTYEVEPVPSFFSSELQHGQNFTWMGISVICIIILIKTYRKKSNK